MSSTAPTLRAPAPSPCGSCPYRRDVPSGVWDRSEYERLPAYDQPTFAQPVGVFLCHQQTGHLCAGWAGCHDMRESLGLRMAAAHGLLSPDEVDATLGYVSPVPLFASGAAACRHGLAEVTAPRAPAVRTIEKLNQRKQRRGGTTEAAQPRPQDLAVKDEAHATPFGDAARASDQREVTE